MSFDWKAPGVIDQLKALWAEGHSCSAIASIMGGGLTRDSVIGKAHRLELAKRGNSEKPRTPHYIPVAARSPAPPPAPILAHTGPPVATRDLEPHQCKWPVSEGSPWFHCGAPREPLRPYCAIHVAATFQPIQPRRDSLRAKPKAEQVEPDAVEMMEGRVA